MYDLPALRAATDAWWAGLARHLRAAGVAGVPTRPRHGSPGWTDPGLLFSQACGYPLTHRLAHRVELLCTPCYRAPGCAGPRYCSLLLVGADAAATDLAELRGGVCAVNEAESHSGMNVLRRMIAPLAGGEAFFARVLHTGSHVASIAAVAAGRADLCAVDAVLHALLRRHQPGSLAGTRVLRRSPGAPGLPYIAGPAVPAEAIPRMRDAVRSALADPRLRTVRDDLLLAGAEPLSWASYEEILAIEVEAQRLGYPRLR